MTHFEKKLIALGVSIEVCLLLFIGMQYANQPVQFTFRSNGPTNTLVADTGSGQGSVLAESIGVNNTEDTESLNAQPSEINSSDSVNLINRTSPETSGYITSISEAVGTLSPVQECVREELRIGSNRVDKCYDEETGRQNSSLLADANTITDSDPVGSQVLACAEKERQKNPNVGAFGYFKIYSKCSAEVAARQPVFIPNSDNATAVSLCVQQRSSGGFTGTSYESIYRDCENQVASRFGKYTTEAECVIGEISNMSTALINSKQREQIQASCAEAFRSGNTGG